MLARLRRFHVSASVKEGNLIFNIGSSPFVLLQHKLAHIRKILRADIYGALGRRPGDNGRDWLLWSCHDVSEDGEEKSFTTLNIDSVLTRRREFCLN